MLRNKLFDDSTAALKARDNRAVSALRFLISVIDKAAFKGDLSEAEELKVLQKELKNKEEALAAAVSAGRSEIEQEVRYEIDLLLKYLPKQLEKEEIEKMVDAAIEKLGKNFPAVMKETVGQVAGRADGSVVVGIVKQKLA